MSKPIEMTGQDLIDFIVNNKAENCPVRIDTADGSHYPNVKDVQYARYEIVITTE